MTSIRDIVFRTLVTGAVLLLLGGCSSTSTATRTDGVEIELFVRADRTSYARYMLAPNGWLSFAGGPDAHVSRYSWTGPMTDEEIVELKRILEANQYYRQPPSSTGRNVNTVEYTLAIETPNGTRKHRVVGTSEALEPLHQLLRTASMRRNADFIDQRQWDPS